MPTRPDILLLMSHSQPICGLFIKSVAISWMGCMNSGLTCWYVDQRHKVDKAYDYKLLGCELYGFELWAVRCMVLSCGLWFLSCGLKVLSCGLHFELWAVIFELWAVSCGLWVLSCGLWVLSCGFWAVGFWAVDFELWVVRCELQVVWLWAMSCSCYGCELWVADSSSDDSGDEDTIKSWMDELNRKRLHPERLHEELWFNEPQEVSSLHTLEPLIYSHYVVPWCVRYMIHTLGCRAHDVVHWGNVPKWHTASYTTDDPDSFISLLLILQWCLGWFLEM